MNKILVKKIQKARFGELPKENTYVMHTLTQTQLLSHLNILPTFQLRSADTHTQSYTFNLRIHLGGILGPVL
jgi:hypothetical protein